MTVGIDIVRAHIPQDFHYAAAVGVVMYLASNLQPGIVFAVDKLT